MTVGTLDQPPAAASRAAQGLSEILAERGDPMAVCRELPWLHEFAEIPDDAAPPLAMSQAHPRAVGSYGAECIAWAQAELGITYRWWQRLAITRQLEHDEDGVLVWREAIETGPRRIGKSVRLRGTALWRLGIAERIGEKQLAMLVSKDLAVGKEIHRGSWRWAESKGWKVIRLNGGQEIEAPDESRWLLRADTAVYGYDVGYGQVDESWGVDPQSITDGLEPAMLERLWSQLHLTSTAHVKATSLMRRRLLAALRNADPDVLLLFWGAHPDADFSAEETWRAASPHWTEDRRALIARKYAAALAGQDEPEFDDPDPVRGWASQYLNVWPGLGGDQANLTLPGWTSIVAQERPEGGPLALGIAADVPRSWLALSAVLDGERRHLGSVHHMPSAKRETFVAEVARIYQENRCPVGIARKGPASFLIEDLEAAGVPLTLLDFDDVAQADADLESAVARGEVEHGDYDDLNAAVSAAMWKTVNDRRVLSRKAGEISSLEGASVALWVSTRGTSFYAGGSDLDLCDQCQERPHEDPEGIHDYLCPACREESP